MPSKFSKKIHPEYVTCNFCNCDFRVLNSQHLLKHGATREDYMQEFGLGPSDLVALEFRAHRAKRKDYKPLQYAEIPEMIRRFYKKHGTVSLSAAHRKAPQLAKQASVMYGGWRNAVRAAGFKNLKLVGLRESWTKKKVIELLRRAGNQKNVPAELRMPLRDACIWYFGSMGEALDAVGISWDDFFGMRRWTKEAIIAELEQYKKVYGEDASRRIRKERASMEHSARKHFGSLIKAQAVVGIKSNKVSWSDQAILAAIRNGLAGGKPTNDAFMRRENPRLHNLGKGRFGTWKSAVEAAGLECTPLRRRWTKEQILSELRQLHESEGLESYFQRRHPDIYAAAERHFGSWGSAKQAALSK